MNKKILILTTTALVTFSHNVWAECSLKYSYSGSNATVTGSSGCDGQSVTIPLTTTKDGKEYKVTAIGGGAFNGNKTITGVTFEKDTQGRSNVTSIGSSAFEGMTGVTGTLEIPNSVTSIGWKACKNMSNVTNLILPNSNPNIVKYAFEGMKSLTMLTIPDTLTSIPEGAFYLMSGVTSVFIPKSVTSIGNSVFYKMSSLKEVFLAEDSPLTDDMLTNAKLDLNKIVRYTADGKYIKGDKVYVNLEDYRVGIALSCKEGSTKCQKTDKDGVSLKGFYNPDGSRFQYRIYSVSEAEEALGKKGKNTFSIRYR